MKGKAEDGLTALNPTALCLTQSLRKCFPPQAGLWITSQNAKTKKKNRDLLKKKCQFLPSTVLLCPLLSVLHPVLQHKLSVFFTIPHSPPREQCVCSPPPPHPSIPPSICVVLSVTSRPCHATRERGRDRPRYCPPGQTHGISIVFLLSSSAERWPVTFRF